MFCAAPFIHSFVSTSGKKFLCCAATRWSENMRDLDDWEGEDYQYIRNHMLTQEEWLPDCHDCRIQESVGEPSLRQAMNKVWSSAGNPSLDHISGNIFGVPFSYDLRLNNLCNLSCRMCGPESSSQIAKEAEKNPELWPSWEKKDDEFKVSLGAKNIDWIIEEAQFIKELKLLGGEPSVQPEIKKLLQKLVDIGNTKLRINVTTNGTNVNNEFFNLLKKFEDVWLTVSIDAHPDRLEYIRGGANGKKIWENIKKMSEMSWTGEISLSTTQVVMSYNLFDFWELGQLIKETSWLSSHRSWMVYTPLHHSAMYVPQKWKEKAIQIAKDNNCYDREKHIFDTIMLEKENIDHLRKLKATTELMDFSRNKYLKDYHPLCHEMLEEIV